MFKTLYNVNEYKCNSYNTIGDRFIPMRSCNAFLNSKYKLSHTPDTCSEKNHLYKDILLETFPIDADAHILNFSKYGCKQKQCTKTKEVVNQWPVKPRKKKWSCDKQPFMVYDLPIYNNSGGLPLKGKINPVDWSTTGFLASTLAEFLWLKNPQTNEEHCFSNPLFWSKYIKWNSSGQMLATIQWNQEEVHTFHMETQEIKSVECMCKMIHTTRCSCKITAVEWRRDDTFLTGCTNGRLCVWKDTQLQHNILLSFGTIIDIKFSSNNQNYLVVMNDSGVNVLHWPPRQLCSWSAHVQALAWHPFQDSLLCVASAEGVILQNIATNKCVGVQSSYSQTKVDSLTWNELSGELVLSRMKNAENINEILVYSNFDTIVENLSYHESHVPCLVWSPDGSILATACLSEEISLWKFFGPNSDRKKLLPQRDPLSIHCNNFGKCIR